MEHNRAVTAASRELQGGELTRERWADLLEVAFKDAVDDGAGADTCTQLLELGLDDEQLGALVDIACAWEVSFYEVLDALAQPGAGAITRSKLLCRYPTIMLAMGLVQAGEELACHLAVRRQVPEAGVHWMLTMLGGESPDVIEVFEQLLADRLGVGEPLDVLQECLDAARRL